MAVAKKKFSFNGRKIISSLSQVSKFLVRNASINVFLVLTLIIFAFFLGLLTNKVIYLEQQVKNAPVATADTTGQAPAAQPVDIETVKALFTDKNLTFGDKNSKNLIVEVADPSCPYCHVAAGKNPELDAQMGPNFKAVADGGTYIAPVPEIKKLVDEGKAAFVWIYYPGHGNGEMGTKAMYCAKEQGKFWEVHDLLMSNKGYDLLNNQVLNDKTKSQDIVDFLADVADASELKSCIDSGKYDTKITEDTATGTALGINGTPGFIINETPFAGAYSWSEMKSAVK